MISIVSKDLMNKSGICKVIIVVQLYGRVILILVHSQFIEGIILILHTILLQCLVHVQRNTCTRWHAKVGQRCNALNICMYTECTKLR